MRSMTERGEEVDSPQGEDGGIVTGMFALSFQQRKESAKENAA